MCPPRLSSELALRVAHAAQQLDLDAKTFMPVLIETIGLPFTKTRFAKTSIDKLAESLAWSETPAAKYAAGETEKLKVAVQTLWGFDPEAEAGLPPLEGSKEDVIPGAIRVAIATSDGECIDEHFGGTLRFFVYRVTMESIALIDIRSTKDSVDAEDATAYRVDLIQDCHLLYVRSIGGPPAGKVSQRGIHPMKVEARTAVRDELKRLRNKMADAPPPWLAKAMGIPVEDRIRYTEAVKS